MPPSIGSHTFAFLRGDSPKRRLEIIGVSAAGEDGNAAQKRGVRAARTVMISQAHVSTAGAIKTNFENYQASIGDVVSVTDDRGNTFTNMRVVDVEQIETGDNMTTGPMLNATDGASWCHMCRWYLEKVA